VHNAIEVWYGWVIFKVSLRPYSTWSGEESMEKDSRASEKYPENEPELEAVEVAVLVGLETMRQLLAEKEAQRRATKLPPWALL